MPIAHLDITNFFSLNCAHKTKGSCGLCFIICQQNSQLNHSLNNRLRYIDYEEAANQALDSLWAKQVGHRATEIAELIRKAAS